MTGKEPSRREQILWVLVIAATIALMLATGIRQRVRNNAMDLQESDAATRAAAEAYYRDKAKHWDAATSQPMEEDYQRRGSSAHDPAP